MSKGDQAVATADPRSGEGTKSLVTGHGKWSGGSDAATADALIRSLFEASLDGILAVNQDGRIVLANAEAERLFDYRPGELVGLSVEWLVPEAQRPGHAASRS